MAADVQMDLGRRRLS